MSCRTLALAASAFHEISAMSTRVLLLALATTAHAQEYMQVGLDAAGRQDAMPGVVPPEPQFFAGAGAMGGPPMGVGGVPGGGGFGGGAPEMPMMGGAGMMGGFGGMPAQQQGYNGYDPRTGRRMTNNYDSSRTWNS